MSTWLRRHDLATVKALLDRIDLETPQVKIASRIVELPQATRVGVWFVGGAIGHDLVLWPLYALADRGAVRAARRHPDRLPATPWINYLRVPVIISGVLLAVSFPLVLRLSPATYESATGLTPAPYLQRWLLITGCLFAVSATAYAARVGVAVRRRRMSRVAEPGS